MMPCRYITCNRHATQHGILKTAHPELVDVKGGNEVFPIVRGIPASYCKEHRDEIKDKGFTYLQV